MMRFLTCLCHLLLASGGFPCLPAATMYHYCDPVSLLWLFFTCIFMLMHVYMVAWYITLKLVHLVKSFIMSKCMTIWCVHMLMMMSMKWQYKWGWNEKNKSAYIQLKWLEDTRAFLPSFSLQLIGYHVRLKLCAPNHAYSWERLVGQ